VSGFVNWPELGASEEHQMFDHLAGLDLEELREQAQASHPQEWFYPTGERAGANHVDELAVSVRELADGLGWPVPPGRNSSEAKEFNRALPRLLHSLMAISPANGARAGVWSFLSLVVLPDVAMWRWPDRPEARVTGHGERAATRNVFRTAWWRAEMLGAGPEDPPALLPEDALVAVQERPGLFRIGALAKVSCSCFLDLSDQMPPGESEEVMRDAAKRLYRWAAYTAFDLIKPSDLAALVERAFSESIDALSSK